MPSLPPSLRNILIRATNWIGDAIMTLPAVRSIRQNYPEARITVLAQPWVADIFAADLHVDRVILYEKKGRHRGIGGMLRLARELAPQRFDGVILLQNAFEAALIARLAGIPVIAGYSRDGRRPLLTHPVKLSDEIRRVHQVHYYQNIVRQLGLTPGPDKLYLPLAETEQRWAREFVAELPRPLVGINPGAAYGPAKRWPAERYGELAARLAEESGGSVLVFGTAQDGEAVAVIRGACPAVIDLTGRTTLSQAMALIARLDLFVTNDSGLMHVAAAAATPLVAIFGSTSAVETGPFADRVMVVQKDFPCIPCLKPECSTDFRCMLEIGVGEVLAGVHRLRGKAR
ncbi:MAG: lipopolysaccharide heptosyltransferase II [Thermodesulfobacteriota bacterium]